MTRKMLVKKSICASGAVMSHFRIMYGLKSFRLRKRTKVGIVGIKQIWRIIVVSKNVLAVGVKNVRYHVELMHVVLGIKDGVSVGNSYGDQGV